VLLTGESFLKGISVIGSTAVLLLCGSPEASVWDSAQEDFSDKPGLLFAVRWVCPRDAENAYVAVS